MARSTYLQHMAGGRSSLQSLAPARAWSPIGVSGDAGARLDSSTSRHGAGLPSGIKAQSAGGTLKTPATLPSTSFSSAQRGDSPEKKSRARPLGPSATFSRREDADVDGGGDLLSGMSDPFPVTTTVMNNREVPRDNASRGVDPSVDSSGESTAAHAHSAVIPNEPSLSSPAIAPNPSTGRVPRNAPHDPELDRADSDSTNQHTASSTRYDSAVALSETRSLSQSTASGVNTREVPRKNTSHAAEPTAGAVRGESSSRELPRNAAPHSAQPSVGDWSAADRHTVPSTHSGTTVGSNEARNPAPETTTAASKPRISHSARKDAATDAARAWRNEIPALEPVSRSATQDRRGIVNTGESPAPTPRSSRTRVSRRGANKSGGVHVGSLEIRVVEPQQQQQAQQQIVHVHAPAAPAAPLARGFSSTFGLRQG